MNENEETRESGQAQISDREEWTYIYIALGAFLLALCGGGVAVAWSLFGG